MDKILPILIMAVITYIIRVTPMVLFKSKIKNPVIQAFLHYIPYCILTAMVVPSIFTSTNLIYAALAGFFTALILSWFEKSLIVVSLSAVFVAYLVEVLF